MLLLFCYLFDLCPFGLRRFPDWREKLKCLIYDAKVSNIIVTTKPLGKKNACVKDFLGLQRKMMAFVYRF